jgi:acyl dehydratase
VSGEGGVSDGPVYLDDLALGAEIDCGEFRLTREEIIDFAERFDPQPFHLDDAAAAASYFGGLCASGIHTQAAALGLAIRAVAGVAVVAGGALERATFQRPVYPDEAHRVTARWVEARPSASNPSRGVAVIAIDVHDSQGRPVMHGGITYILARKLD